MQVVYPLGTSWGGIPHYTASLANAMADVAEPVVLKPEGVPDDLFNEAVTTETLFFDIDNERLFSMYNLQSVLSYRSIARIRQIDPDLVHFTEIPPNLVGPGHLTGVVGQYPTVTTVHGTFESFRQLANRGNVTEAVIIYLTRKYHDRLPVNRTIVHSEQNKEELVADGFAPDEITVIPHGVYTQFTTDDETDPSEQESSDTFRVLFFGYLRKNKGIHNFVEAVVRANERSDGKVRGHIVGEGELPTDLLAGNESIFDVRNEYVPDDEVADVFETADVVALPYVEHGGHSGVLTIALSFGRPIIVSDVSDFPISDGEDAIVIPPDDSMALADAISELRGDKELQRSLSAGAKATAERISWPSIAERHLKLYQSLLD